MQLYFIQFSFILNCFEFLYKQISRRQDYHGMVQEKGSFICKEAPFQYKLLPLKMNTSKNNTRNNPRFLLFRVTFYLLMDLENLLNIIQRKSKQG